MIELLELKFSRRWQTNKIESDWSNSPRHSSSRQFRSPRSCKKVSSTLLHETEAELHVIILHLILIANTKVLNKILCVGGLGLHLLTLDSEKECKKRVSFQVFCMTKRQKLHTMKVFHSDIWRKAFS